MEELAQKFEVNFSELYSLLESEDGDQKLNSSDLDFYANLYSNPYNAEYMKFYGLGKLASKSQVELLFKGRLQRMWNYDKVRSLAFILYIKKKAEDLKY